MFRFARLPLFLFGLTMALALHPASAQGPAGFLPPVEELEGLKAAVARAHTLDFSQFEAIPEDSTAEAETYRDALAFGGLILEFETSAQADSAYEAIVANGVSAMTASLGIENPDLTESDLDDLGERAHAFSVYRTAGSTEGYVRVVVMKAETYVFFTMIMTEAEESSLDADAMTAHFAEGVAEGHTGPGTFVEGTADSTGGLWDFFPAANDELWAGLVAEPDEILFPAP